MRAWPWLLTLVVPLAAPFVACHSDETPTQQQQPGYPAFPFDLPQVHDNGHAKMKNPNIVVFRAPDDFFADDLHVALKSLKTSGYWSAATSEYGIGPVGNITFADITVPTTLSSKAAYDLLAKAIAMRFSSSSDAGAMDDSGADASLDGGVDGAAVDAGPPVLHADTLYTLLLPPETTLKDVSCDIGAYHDAMVLNGVDAFPYAIVRQDCDYDWRSMVNNAVHELVEAATDPFPHVYPGPGVLGIGLRFVAWDYANQNEIADLCIGIPSTSPDVPSLNNGNTKLTFPTVWSNRLAAMGQNPCVPMDPEAPHVFASAWAILPEVAPDSIATGAPWVRLAVGDSTTVDVHVASDGPADLTLLAYDFASQDGSSPAQLDVSLDSTSAHNGDVRKLTIKRLSVQRTMYDPDGVSVFGIATSQANGDGFVTYGIVGVP